MPGPRAVITAFLFFSIFHPVRGQDALHRRDAPVQEYVLGPGDQISLEVVDMEEISSKPLRIDGSGFVDVPFAGRLQAAGLTSEQFKAELAAKLSKYVDKPQIALNVIDNQSRPVSVLGAVNNPGVQQIQGPKHLLEALSMAGGARQDAGPKLVLTRQMKWGILPVADARLDGSGTFSTATFPLDELMAGKDPAANLLLQPGDAITIPKAELVYVVGDVKKAGGFALSTHSSVTLLQALSLAEGFGPDASPKTSRILRPAPGSDGTPKEISVDIRQIYAGKAPDVPLYANDILFIPSSSVKVVTRRAIEAAIGVGSGVAIYRH